MRGSNFRLTNSNVKIQVKNIFANELMALSDKIMSFFEEFLINRIELLKVKNSSIKMFINGLYCKIIQYVLTILVSMHQNKRNNFY